jgi:hypothetical protein
LLLMGRGKRRQETLVLTHLLPESLYRALRLTVTMADKIHGHSPPDRRVCEIL